MTLLMAIAKAQKTITHAIGDVQSAICRLRLDLQDDVVTDSPGRCRGPDESPSGSSLSPQFVAMMEQTAYHTLHCCGSPLIRRHNGCRDLWKRFLEDTRVFSSKGARGGARPGTQPSRLPQDHTLCCPSHEILGFCCRQKDAPRRAAWTWRKMSLS